MMDHTWTDWAPDGDENHKRECMDDICDAFETLPHDWDDGVVTTEPSCTEKGVKTYTCQTCQHTKTEELHMADHQWTDWSPNGDGTHTRACRCNATETGNCVWDGGVVTQQPTHYEEGIRTYTCSTCSGTKTESIAKTSDHQWSDWAAMNDGRTHIRECKCGVTETLAHNWTAWAEQSTGQYKRECTDCGAAEISSRNKTLITSEESSIWKIWGLSHTASVLSALAVGMPLRSTGLNSKSLTSVITTLFPVFSEISFATWRIPCDLPTPGGPHSITDGKLFREIPKLISDI
jgi:hypothetical protein